MKKSEIEKWMQEKLNNNVWLCDFHNNYTFLEYVDKFASSLTPKQRRRQFNYYAKKLSKLGKCIHSYTYLSATDTNNFGARTINNYYKAAIV
jgi:hypothetical protein